jgi:hypothetical protein
MSYDYHKEQRRDGGKKLIAEVLKDYTVRDINQGYCFRVNGSLDLYPTSGKFHNIRTNVRGRYPNKEAGKLIAFVVEQMNHGNKISREIHQAAHSGSGSCVFCGKGAELYMCVDCKSKPFRLLGSRGQENAAA